MNSQEITVYREIQRNTEMAMTALEKITNKISDRGLARQAAKQSVGYTEIHNVALDQILEAKASPYHTKPMANAMLKTAVACNTFMDSSTGHIAELLMKGSNMGVIEMNKVLNRNTGAGEESVALANKLLDFEAKNLETLKKYL